MKFTLYAGGVALGWSALEGADASMGCASGVFHANENYQKVEAIILRYSERCEIGSKGSKESYAKVWDEIVALDLVVRAEDGEALEPIGGVSLVDYAAELGEETGRELSVLGLPHEQFKRYFREACDWFYKND